MANGIYYIYKITNKVNNKIYIGFTSKTPEKRLMEHINTAVNKKGKSYFHKAIRKYGKSNFIVETLEESTNRDYCLNILENKYISQYNSMNHSIGYNLRSGGECGTFTDEWKKKMSKIRKEGFRTGKYIPVLKNKTFEEVHGIEKSKIIKDKISKHHANVIGKNNPMYHKNIKDFMTEEDYNKWKLSNVGKKSNLSKSFIIINPITNEVIYQGKGLNQFTKDIGYKHPSSLKRFIKNGRPIHTKHNTIYEGCIIKYI